MKYVFYVHSHISYYMSLSVIKHLEIRKKNIVFAYARNYTPPSNESGFKHIDLSEILNSYTHLTISNILRIPQTVRQLDKIISSATENDEFAFFVPQMGHIISHIIATNKKCLQFDFIEEGSAYYVEDNYRRGPHKYGKVIMLIFKLLNIFCRRIQFEHPMLAPLKGKSEPNYYVMRSPYVINTGRVIYLDISPDGSMTLDKPYDDRPILVMGAVLENKLAEYGNVLRCYEHIIRQMSIQNGLYVKLHPQSGHRTLKLLEEIKGRNNVELQFIDQPVEQILLYYKGKKPLYICGINSSLLFYAKIISPKNVVVTGCKYLMDLDPIYRKKMPKGFDTLLDGTQLKRSQ